MDTSNKMAPQASLFQVYLRLRPPIQPALPRQATEPWLIVEPPSSPTEQTDAINDPSSTHITLQPPNDSRKRAIERFGFTKIFRQEARQLDIFDETGAADTIRSLLQTGRDGLVATLGVTGSGKSHTILGSKSERGLTQMTLDVLFRSIGEHIRRPHHPDLPTDTALLSSLQASDPSEAHILSATTFLESMYGDGDRARLSRAQTPMSRAQTPMVRSSTHELPGSFPVSPSSRTARPSVTSVSNHSTASTVLMLSCGTEQDPSFEKEPWRPPSKVPFMNRLRNLKKSPAKLMLVKESMGHSTRRPPLPPPSTLPQHPDVTSFAADIDQQAEYVVLVSMYEVYNDRIFDLLSNPSLPNAPMTATRQGAALQKGLMRRPLLFKNTEMSPDVKVVAGLRKIVCGSYDEAMMVLETGLTERRVAGTGSNSVSSRSHGFFCVEVKRRSRPQYSGYVMAHSFLWTGGTMTICDLAGSERARNAKTTGSTLAEAGKINESLMYLGQCLQVMNDCQQEGSKPIVPFRQCKLTELLFSNSFPSANHGSAYRQPQKGVMIVTADPQGDFNATSQILRYSAMAREVTVPRVPSVTSTILAGGGQGKALPSGRTTPHDAVNPYFAAKELEQATHEAARLAEECDLLVVRLAEEEIKRTEAELKLQAATEKAQVMEQEIREECWREMEERLDEERERWRTAWEQERVKSEEFVDGKLELMEKTANLTIYEDATATGQLEQLQHENERLRAQLRALEQELQHKSPTKKFRGSAGSKSPVKGLVLQESANINVATNPFLASLRASARDSDATIKAKKSEDDLNVCDVSPRKLSLRSSSVTRVSASNIHEEPVPVKKQRKLTTRKWDLGDPDDF
ncbi:hypothetical protein A1O7_07921 [Cladophialophora yegresii CBS 114405]|uniref:Kinesin-like protein n=1 Tax=Cladophialophora yegresii CBS 114405 TaxID=1182544 RepID=W9VPV3_9EURO|nr:uncharacterized protein A1O7_07921 [Cladophialophora yegresii CBS 114405]EXJ57573.1 hypothetical protein A1O7_07921 [Cladophialophora yegresii CBS 114405]